MMNNNNNNSNNMSNPKRRQFQHSDTYQRINYLYQAAIESLRTNRDDPSLCRFYVYNLKTIARRNVLHLHPEMKRTMCKRCCVLLIPAVTCRVRIRRKRQKHTVVTCLECGTIRRYVHDPSKPPPWIDTPDAWEDKVVDGECVTQGDQGKKKQKTQQQPKQKKTVKNTATVSATVDKTKPVGINESIPIIKVAEETSEKSHSKTIVVEHVMEVSNAKMTHVEILNTDVMEVGNVSENLNAKKTTVMSKWS